MVGPSLRIFRNLRLHQLNRLCLASLRHTQKKEYSPPMEIVFIFVEKTNQGRDSQRTSCHIGIPSLYLASRNRIRAGDLLDQLPRLIIQAIQARVRQSASSLAENSVQRDYVGENQEASEGCFHVLAGSACRLALVLAYLRLQDRNKVISLKNAQAEHVLPSRGPDNFPREYLLDFSCQRLHGCPCI